ncbi:MAG: polysaccharide pyruvyl transferase family protein [Ignavibacteria bacterium]|nr:polysaccharide pyruvyl transferase family protein [Ignavibacteria bacterium]
MNILISNVYSWKNKGDAAIILSMIDHIKSEFPNAVISISSIDEADEGKYQESNFHTNFLTLVKQIYGHSQYTLLNRFSFASTVLSLKIKLKLFEFFANRNIFLYSLFHPRIIEKIRSYAKYDFVIAAGGGYFLSKNKKNKLESLFNHDEQVLFAYDFYCATFFNKPFMLYNQSIGPFYNRQDAENLLPFLTKANAVICRETITYSLMKKLGLKNILLSEDSAFNLKSFDDGSLIKFPKETDEISIGITVRVCLPDVQQKKYEDELSRFITIILERHSKAKFYFMPQVIFEHAGDNDLHTARRIFNSLPTNLHHRVNIIDEDFHPSVLKYFIGSMHYFFGTRMHSCIFALASNVKTIALSYEPKTDGIMQSLKMDEYYIDVKDVEAEKLLDLYHKIQLDDNYYARLNKEVKRVQKESLIDLKKIVVGHI